jgi:WD40 repeat protein
MNFFYKLGGSLGKAHPTYIKRQADEDLYNNLLEGDFCYVLTSRQMGKSSLRVRVMERLKEDGFGCILIDLTEICSHNGTEDQWYRAILGRLITDLKLTKVVDPNEVWALYQSLSPLQRLNEFVNTILFTHVTTPIVIFVDEIDRTISLGFDTDDFFAWIRYCYNFRTDNPNYKRLTFCLLGVATPTDLIKDKSRTPFNIGKSIEPLRFRYDELNPLMEGLRKQNIDLKVIQHEIHKWTGGQPFLTQRLCFLVQSNIEQIEFGYEKEIITKLVEKNIIENWENSDRPAHLQTIRDRLLKDQDKVVSLLGLYQRILASTNSQESIKVEGNLSEVMALRLTGLVVAEEGYLFVYNEIYRRVFSAEWVAKELERLRPYAVSLAQWLANDRDDKYLLTGQGFLDAQKWSLTRRLTEEDSQYLAASQKLQTENVQAQAEEMIRRAKKRATLFMAIGVSGLLGSVIASGIALFNFNEVIWRTWIEQANTETLSTFSEKTLERTISAIRVGRHLRQRIRDEHINKYPTYSPLDTLRQAITSEWYESNRFSIGNDESILAVSANSQTIIASDKDRNAKILKQDGSIVAKLSSFMTRAKISADGQTIISNAACHEHTNSDFMGYADINGIDLFEYSENFKCSTLPQIIKIWKLDGSLASTIKQQSLITSISISGDGKYIASGGKDGTIYIWRYDGSLISTFKGHKSNIAYLRLSEDGQIITSYVGNGTFKIWNRNGSLISTFKNQQSLGGLNFSDDGQSIITYNLKNSYDANDFDFDFSVDETNIEKLSKFKKLSQDVANRNIKVWKWDGSLATTIPTVGQSDNSVSMSFDGQVIASAGINASIQVWNQNGSLLDTFPGKEEVSIIKVSSNGRTIISSSSRTVKIRQKNSSINSTLSSHLSTVNSVGISADGQTIISGSNDKTVKLWSKNGTLLHTLKDHKNRINSVAISADGQTIVSGGIDGTVNLRDKNGVLITSMKDLKQPIYDVSISGDGKAMVYNNGYENVKVRKPDGFDIATIKNDKKYKSSSVAISTDGQTIVSASGIYDSNSIDDVFDSLENEKKTKSVKIWRRNGTLIKMLTAHQDGVKSVAISADGQIIIAGIDNGAIMVWRRDGTLIKTLAAHQSNVNSVAISADGQTIVSGGDSNLVKVWRQDGTLIATLTGHQAPITSVGISADGKTIVSGSYDKTVRIWHFDLDYLLAKGCEQIKDYLNSHPEVNREELCPK